MTTNASGQKRSGARKSQPPLTPADSLAMLRSAVGYVMQAGLTVNAGTVGGALVIKVAGACVDSSGDVVRFVPALPNDVRPAQTAEDVPARG